MAIMVNWRGRCWRGRLEDWKLYSLIWSGLRAYQAAIDFMHHLQWLCHIQQPDAIEYILKAVLPARPLLLPALICLHADCCHLWNYFCFYTHNTVAIKHLSGKITPKKNLTLSLEFDGHAGEPGDKDSWLVEDWGYQKRATFGTRATQSTLPAGPTWTSNTTVLYVDSLPPQRESDCLNLFWTHESIQ